MVMAAFDPRHVKAYLPSLVTVATRLETRWRKAATVRTEIDLQADLMRYTVDAIAGLAFGADVNTLEAEDAIQKHLNLIFPAIARRVTSAIPYWRYFKLPRRSKARAQRWAGEGGHRAFHQGGQRPIGAGSSASGGAKEFA
jgi:cytochrome P450